MTTDIAVIILTKDEEANIAQALKSVVGWARQVFVFDSFSTDNTVTIARSFDCTVVQHAFEDYGKQRNHALDSLPISTEWVFFLDADEWIPEELKREIETTISASPKENGFFVKRRFIWMGNWVKRGYYPTWILRMFRQGKGRCEQRAVNEHIIVDGNVGYLQHDFMHEDLKDVHRWIARHNVYATKEAEELLRADADGLHAGNMLGSQVERKRWLRQTVWNRLPPLFRPFAYFSYRYLARGGFLDGRQALSFHLLQAFWFPLLVDVKYLELKRRSAQPAND